jgi:hypothetical protein
MDPIITPTLIWAVSNYLAAHTIVAVVVAVAVLTVSGLAEWFRDREGLLERNKDALAFTLGSMIDNKQYVEIPGLFSGKPGSNRIVQGIYDKKKGEIVAMRAVAAQRLDPEIARAHGSQRLAIYSRAA